MYYHARRKRNEGSKLTVGIFAEAVSLCGMFLRMFLMIIIYILLLIMLAQFGPPGSPHPFCSWEVSVGHIEYNGGQGFNVIFGQCESLYFGKFILSSHMRDYLPQGLECIVELVHSLPLPLVAFQSPQMSVFTAPRVLGSGCSNLAALLTSLIPPFFVSQAFHQFFFFHCWLLWKCFFINSILLLLPFGFSLHVSVDVLVLSINVLQKHDTNIFNCWTVQHQTSDLMQVWEVLYWKTSTDSI